VGRGEFNCRVSGGTVERECDGEGNSMRDDALTLKTCKTRKEKNCTVTLLHNQAQDK
jgi:hypothetical protein